MPGTFQKPYTFQPPMRLPVQAKVEFTQAGVVVGEATLQVQTFGTKLFSFLTDREDLDLEAMTTRILFWDGTQWTADTYAKVEPYAFNFPFCFSGLKIGFR